MADSRPSFASAHPPYNYCVQALPAAVTVSSIDQEREGLLLVQPICPSAHLPTTATNKAAGTPSSHQVLLSFPASILLAWGSAEPVRLAETNRGELGTGL
ncbi:hypothetical protein DHEL01_v211839 [Diaporthe helianthi]|uniref:Uncharacterized protein n=1 Tax=Diaporthe helianthi TaxID=158607 RepID=A0A2P5HHP2_DIAHE|nr:hypothetical protein DHEL01_v211839 [Diaporthe helianthi]